VGEPKQILRKTENFLKTSEQKKGFRTAEVLILPGLKTSRRKIAEKQESPETPWKNLADCFSCKRSKKARGKYFKRDSEAWSSPLLGATNFLEERILKDNESSGEARKKRTGAAAVPDDSSASWGQENREKKKRKWKEGGKEPTQKLPEKNESCQIKNLLSFI